MAAATYVEPLRNFAVKHAVQLLSPGACILNTRKFVLEATGWLGTVSGFQSLISLYLLAMWVLTYFGRLYQ